MKSNKCNLYHLCCRASIDGRYDRSIRDEYFILDEKLYHNKYEFAPVDDIEFLLNLVVYKGKVKEKLL